MHSGDLSESGQRTIYLDDAARALFMQKLEANSK